jgi:hypothetical protein
VPTSRLGGPAGAERLSSGGTYDRHAASSILVLSDVAMAPYEEGQMDSEATAPAASGGADPFLFEPVPMLSRAIAREGDMLADSCSCTCSTEQCGCTSYCYCNTGGCSCRMVLV